MLSKVKTIVKSTPVLGPLLVSMRERPVKSSARYWETRYRRGGSSGAGSYNRLAHFKAEFLNLFVERERVGSVLELGCGDGAQLRLAHYPRYIGIDVAPTVIERCRSIFEGDTSKRFHLPGELADDIQADLTISLDVIYHLLEDDIFDRYMHEMFARARRYVIVYSSDREASWDAKHVRHREFTAWVKRNQPNWLLTAKEPNRYPYDPVDPENTSFADFFVFTKKLA